jgi:hypothetical protein
VEGVVTAEAGRLGTAGVAAIQDATAGIAVRLPAAYLSLARGTAIRMTGTTAEPNAQLELRSITELIVVGDADVPPALDSRPGDIGEDIEGQLVTITATVDSAVARSASGDLAFDVASDEGRARVVADATSGLAKSSFARGSTYRLVGVVGQHASKRGAADGYRLWVRDINDVARIATPSPTPTPQPKATPTPKPTPKPTPTPHGSPAPSGQPSPSASPSPSGSPSPSTSPTRLSIARALLTHDQLVSVAGRVTAPGTLLDATGRRIVIEDATAAVEVYLPAGTTAPSLGASVRVDGRIVRAYGAPRLRATAIAATTGVAPVTPVRLTSAPGAAHEWRLVSVAGEVVDVRKLGDRWHAELALGSTRVPISGLAGSRIASTALIESGRATITGIVKRAYPGAADTRFSIAPRSPADITSTAASPKASPSSSGGTRTAAGNPTASSFRAAGTVVDVDIIDLDQHVGRAVRIGGLVMELGADGAVLDDGTATGRVVLADAAAEYLPLLEVGDAINATGTVERRANTLIVLVREAAGIARVGDPTPAEASAAPDAAPSTIAAGTAATTAASTGGLPLGFPGVGLATVALLSLASGAITLARRRHLRLRPSAALARLRAGPGRAEEAGREVPSEA